MVQEAVQRLQQEMQPKRDERPFSRTVEEGQEKEQWMGWQEKANNEKKGVNSTDEPAGTKCIGRRGGVARVATTYSIQTRSAAYEKVHSGED